MKMVNGTYKYYAGNIVYNKDKLMDYLLFDEGMVTKTSGGYSYEYHPRWDAILSGSFVAINKY